MTLFKQRKTTVFLVFLCVQFMFLPPMAKAQFEKRIGQSFRSMGMGGTSLTTASDTGTLYVNPAAMANIQQSFWDIAALTVEWNKGGAKFAETLQKFEDTVNTPADYIQIFNEYRGEAIFYGLRLDSAYYNYILDQGLVWGVTYAYDSNFNLEIDKEVDTGASIDFRVDEVLQAGISLPLERGRYVFGLGARSVKRTEVSLSYKLSDALAGTDPPKLDNTDGISGIGYDVGFLYRHPHKSRFKFAVVAQNIGGMKFESDDTAFSEQKQEISVGISASPVINRWNFKFALDFRDAAFEYFEDDDPLLRLHLGMEIGHIPIHRTFNIFALRFGLNQGYPTFGVEGNLGFQKNLILGYAYYSLEKGEKAGDLKEPRSVVYLSIGF